MVARDKRGIVQLGPSHLETFPRPHPGQVTLWSGGGQLILRKREHCDTQESFPGVAHSQTRPADNLQQVAQVIKHPPANAGDLRDRSSIPGSGRSPGERKWQSTSVLQTRESHGQRSLAGYGPQDLKELDMNEVTQHVQHPNPNSLYQHYQQICMWFFPPLGGFFLVTQGQGHMQ